jgi:hypothetical protein
MLALITEGGTENESQFAMPPMSVYNKACVLNEQKCTLQNN